MPDNNNNNGFGLGPNNQDPNRRGSLMATIMWIVIPLLLIGSMFFSFNSNANKTRDEYYEVISYFDQGEVKQYSLNLSSGKLVYTLKGEKEARSYTVPNVELFVNDVHDSVHEYNKAHPDKPIKQNYIAGSSRSWMVEILPLLFSTLIMAAIIIWFMRRMNNNIMGDAQRGMGFGKARVKKGGEEQKTTFADVAGADEEKEELQEIVEFLKDPKKYDALGARIPKGVLMVGPPGTGKTLLARATAGEAGVPFFSISGSDFVEMYVGVGASRVRDLFDQAKKSAPAIIFIDEIDAIGRKRGEGNSAHGEEMALNALLTEMDGFSVDPRRPVFVMAATNFDVEEGKGGLGVIDPALARRFDRRVLVDLPNEEEREQLLRMLLKKQPGNTVTDGMIQRTASRTMGLSPAALTGMVESASRMAVKAGKPLDDGMLDEAHELMRYGAKKEWGYEYLERVARHESGHAFLCYLGGNTPSYLTIVARGDHGGYMEHSSKDMGPLSTREEMLARIRTSLGGRAAEIAYYGEEEGVSTGASGDLEQATRTAAAMLCAYGMDGDFGLAAMDLKEALRDREARARINTLLGREMANTVDIIRQNKPRIDRMVDALMKKNKLTGAEMEVLLGD